LRFIDKYLAEANNRDLVKQAIHISKSYFF
jgi:hypothetical protein